MRPDITLVHPLFISKDPVEQKLMTPYFPLGLLYLAAVLRQHGYVFHIFDCTFHQDYREFEAYMATARPPVVGITSLITIRRHALIPADIAHRYGATVIVGGPDPTGLPERYLSYRSGGEFPVDMVVHDEGELTLLDVMDFLHGRRDVASELREISGLRLRGENGEVVATPTRPLIPNLDVLPFPARDLVDMDAYRQAWRKAHGYWALSIINTRGCPYACTCSGPWWGLRWRTPKERGRVRLGFDLSPLAEPLTGVGRYATELLKHLKPRWPGEIVTLAGQPRVWLDRAVPYAVHVAPPWPMKKTLWLHALLPWQLLSCGVDLVHFTNNVAPWFCPCPYVLTVHDASLWLWPQSHSTRRLVAMRPFVPWAARRAAAVITVSRAARDDLVRVASSVCHRKRSTWSTKRPRPTFGPPSTGKSWNGCGSATLCQTSSSSLWARWSRGRTSRAR